LLRFFPRSLSEEAGSIDGIDLLISFLENRALDLGKGREDAEEDQQLSRILEWVLLKDWALMIQGAGLRARGRRVM
jgi:hypothetical protein